MAVFKCKMCGGTLEVMDGATTGECQYCGTMQTLPKLNDDKKANMYDRANHFRRNNEFDKARAIYEQILNEDNTDAESYWSIILCQYGIEYVEDPVTHKRVPTVNRAQFTSVLSDENYKKAIEYADVYQKSIYEEEAKAIDEIQKGILAISQKEEPFDVFICYKETGADGRRTPDSVLANDLYHQLTQEGFKVFFSRITLEDKLGSAYEPYIFAALNSAKVMVVVGTKPEYFNAVWVKNEWSRYLSLIKSGSNKILIPAYRDMDPYDLPEEFSHLQAQDMSKLGFMQDLIRGIKKLMGEETKVEQSTPVVTPVVPQSNADPLLERAFMFLEDGDWVSADKYCEKVLDIDPKNAQAYVGKLLVELKVNRKEDLEDQEESFADSNNYEKVLRFADEKLKEELKGYVEYIDCRNDNMRKESIYNGAKEFMQGAKSEDDYKKAAGYFESIIQYLDSAELAELCHEKAEEERKRKEEETKKCTILFGKYKEALRKEINKELEVKEANKKLASLNKREQILLAIKGEWRNIEDSLSFLDEKIQTIQTEMDSLENEKSKLGFFAAYKKSDIVGRINDLEKQQQLAKVEIISIEKKKQGFNMLSEVENEINEILQNIEKQKTIIDDTDCAKEIQSLRDELNSFEYGKRLLKIFDSIRNIKEGEYITLGEYQRNSTDKGPVEWLVLEIKDGKALVISRYGLDCKPYNTTDEDVTWETCTLREWLNNEFISAAFSSAEKSIIPTVTVTADANPKYDTDPGNPTQDQVFLLSITEAKKYFGSGSERQCKPTAYAVHSGAYVSHEKSIEGKCKWYLRSPGGSQNYVAYVNDDDGYIRTYGNHVNWGHCAVRPALWINLNS